MRIIKFRGWHIGLNKMFPAAELGADELTLNPDGRGFVNVSSENKLYSEYYSNIIPLQYTGLKDKNGVEIYEGDIITAIDSIRQLRVEYSEDVACFEATHSVGARALNSYVKHGVLIVGNIYEIGTYHHHHIPKHMVGAGK